MALKKWTIALLAGILLLVPLLTAGCSSDNNNPSATPAVEASPQGEPADSSAEGGEAVPITWGAWGSAQDFDAFNTMGEGIHDTVPEISKIDFVQYATASDFWTSLPSQITAGTAPDIVLLTNENVYEYIKGGLILPMDKDSLTTLGDIYPEGVDVWTVDGDLYGYPVDMQPACFFINLDLWKDCGLTEADYPKTWDDVRTICERVKSEGKDYSGLCLNAEGMFFLTQVVQGFGGGWNAGETIVSDQNAAAVQWMFDMFRDGLAVSPKQIGADWDGSAFTSGQALMSVGGTWYLGQIKVAAPDMDYVALPIPQQDSEHKVTTLHSDAIVILRNCENVDLATKAAEYIGRAEGQTIREEGTGNIPSIPSLAEEYYVKHPQFAPLEDALSYAVSFGYPEKTSSFLTTFVNEFTKVVYDSSNTTMAQDMLQTVADTYEK